MIFTAEQLAVHANLTLSNAIRHLEAVKGTFLRGHVGKQTRPWFVLDFPSMFPADETLIGFEIETGFLSDTARAEFMSWLWDNTDYTTVDREGCSDYPTEITFPPMPMSILTSDDSPITKMFEYNEGLATAHKLQATRVSSTYPNGHCVGTHTNISTARYRALSATHRSNVASFLASFFAGLTGGQHYALLGRRPYIDGVARNRGGTGDGANRIEFKMFHTTTNIEQFQNYLKVSQRLAELIDAQAATPTNSICLDRNRTFAFLTQDLLDGCVIAPGNPQYQAAIRNEAVRTSIATRESVRGDYTTAVAA